MNETISSGVLLQRLIQNHHFEILDREKNNVQFMHLYNIGMYWVAFEQSAYRLNDIFRHCEITLFRVPACPEYVVMASVPVDEAEAYFHKYLVSNDGGNHKVLSVTPLATRDYYKWRGVAVRSVLW